MWKTVLSGGGLAGTLDIISAFTYFGAKGVPAFRILQTIASGLLGAASYRGGATTALLGVGLHYLIACTAAGVYYAASVRKPLLNRRPLLSGVLYGGAVYAFMNGIVLPLSAVARSGAKQPLADLIYGVLAVVLLVGVPIALVSYQNRPERSPAGAPANVAA